MLLYCFAECMLLQTDSMQILGGKSLISIRKIVEKYKDLIPSLLAVHALTRCDTVPKMLGTGKGKPLKLFLQNITFLDIQGSNKVCPEIVTKCVSEVKNDYRN